MHIKLIFHYNYKSMSTSDFISVFIVFVRYQFLLNYLKIQSTKYEGRVLNFNTLINNRILYFGLWNKTRQFSSDGYTFHDRMEEPKENWS